MTGDDGADPSLSGTVAPGSKDVHTSEPPELLIPRLYAACAGQVARIEERLRALLPGDGDLSEIDKTVKTLAAMAKTLELLIELERSRAREALAEPDADTHAEPDALRAELAKRLSGLCGGRADGNGAAEPEPRRDETAFERLGLSGP
ncbi:hypothetical protein GCM10011316_23720 [Roseibium aquae]|uniref:Uncharacterized protein n=1 Tax=Roseibium aquae TaxID=1323746 RepID=A0A916TK30_9HYPH|nr:hypothetical protein [Roseibium aquae]GGB50896.1 hypothetical protein GCM10011316_23720 [Roseibium aquae]